ncbi:hypothetical protein KY308_02815, partial [Candidatus Woesearchaeota archaeon]|nr:hypothetical protein [Candidatus Woesearchaeota archaeon]
MIFQRFDLNEEALNDKIENEEVKVNFPEASRELIKRLCEKNYQVMHTMNYVNGVPTQIIIGSGVHAGLDHKTD